MALRKATPQGLASSRHVCGTLGPAQGVSMPVFAPHAAPGRQSVREPALPRCVPRESRISPLHGSPSGAQLADIRSRSDWSRSFTSLNSCTTVRAACAMIRCARTLIPPPRLLARFHGASLDGINHWGVFPPSPRWKYYYIRRPSFIHGIVREACAHYLIFLLFTFPWKNSGQCLSSRRSAISSSLSKLRDQSLQFEPTTPPVCPSAGIDVKAPKNSPSLWSWRVHYYFLRFNQLIILHRTVLNGYSAITFYNQKANIASLPITFNCPCIGRLPLSVQSEPMNQTLQFKFDHSKIVKQ